MTAPALRPSTAVVCYDGTVDGFLSVVFDAYRRRERPAHVVAEGAGPSTGLFADARAVASDPDHAARVHAGLVRRLGAEGTDVLRRALLSEAPGIDDAAFVVAERALSGDDAVLDDLRDPAVLRVVRMAGRVRTEVHRMHAFVRFERRAGLAGDGGEVWVARIAPVVHVLPLLGEHFAGRYGSQQWAIADVRRGLALLHVPGRPIATVLADPLLDLDRETDERRFQQMWRRYVTSVDIRERRNPRLQRRHLPLRYRPYLTEWTAEDAPER